MIGIIYRTTCLINNKKYIGKHECKTTDFDGYLGSGKKLINAIKKYGKENFIRQTIRIVNDDENINELEIYYIKINDAVNRKDYYNILEGGQGYSGGENHPNKTPEKRKLLSEHHANVSGKNNPMYGKARSDVIERNKKAQHKIVNRIKIYCIEYPDIIFNSLEEVRLKYKNLGWSGLASTGSLSQHLNKPSNHKYCGKDNFGNKLHWKKY